MPKLKASEEFSNDEAVVRYVMECRQDADDAKQERMRINERNYDMFFLRHDFTHKKKGQSKEILSKQRMAVTQIVSFFQQALADIDDWWRVDVRSNEDTEQLPIRPEEIEKLTNWQLQKANYYSHVGNSVQQGLLGSLMISKTAGKVCPKPKFTLKKGKKGKKAVQLTDDKTWQLTQTLVPCENFYPDPIAGRNLYEIEDIYMDLHEVIAQSKGEDAIYNAELVSKLSVATSDEHEEKQRRARETGEERTVDENVPRVKITEFWGDVIDKKGNKVWENVVITVANEKHLIRKPEDNPLWHQESPYTVAPLIEIANSVWHIALMDAPTMHNKAQTEIYNLTVDSAMKAVHGVNQIRIDALDDATQVSDGIEWGTTLAVNGNLAPGQKVMEPVVTGDIPSEVLSIMNIMQQEFNSSALTNDLRQGVIPFRQVKATEVMEASQTITSVFQGIAKNVEALKIHRDLEKAWQTVAQNIDKISKDELQALFGKERGEQISQMSPEEVFVATVNGVKFKVFGVSMTLSKAQDFRKLTTLLQTVGGSEVLLEAFAAKYDFAKLLGQIMTSLDIDKTKIELPEVAQAGNEDQELGQAGANGADDLSQVPQAGAGSLADVLGQPDFSEAQPDQGGFPGGGGEF